MIYDTDGYVIYSAALALRSTEVKTVTVQIDCVAGYSLYGEAVADVAVVARKGSSGGFTNIETTPLDLSTWAGTTQTFEIKLTAGTITSFTRHAFTLTVKR